jgi:hypothetical protein
MNIVTGERAGERFGPLDFIGAATGRRDLLLPFTSTYVTPGSASGREVRSLRVSFRQTSAKQYARKKPNHGRIK